MRVAFITFEYPPDTSGGGIATYMYQAAKILYERGHDVEVFCASYARDETSLDNDLTVHRCMIKRHGDFRKKCADRFEQIHSIRPFDIIESAEIHADAYEIKKRLPKLPLVVKLHMPLFLQMRLCNHNVSKWTKLRFFLGSLRRGKIRKYGSYDFENDIEYLYTQHADGIVSPSISLQKIISNEWRIPQHSISIIPYPFSPPKELATLQPPWGNKVVAYVGKLNVQKGIVNFIKAIPKIIKLHPDVHFRIIGSDSYYAPESMMMSDYIKYKLNKYRSYYKLEGALSYDDLLKAYGGCSVCVFPSLWENVGLVCLEAMSAARAVVGTQNGGMSEVLQNNSGLMIDPLDPQDIAAKISFLLSNPKIILQLGLQGRQRLKDYDPHSIAEKMENHYIRIIKKANERQENSSLSFP